MKYQAAALLLAALTSAVPDVTVEQLPYDCQTFPDTHQVGQNDCESIFQFYADSTGNSDVDGKHSTLAPVSADIPAWGRVAIVSDNAIAWPQFRFTSTTENLEVYAQDPSTAATFSWVPLKFEANDDNLELLYRYVVAGYRPAAYAIYDAETEENIPGVFLGANGQVTWAFSVGTDRYGRDQYNIRLLANETAALRDGEFKGFLKASSMFE